MAEIKIEKKAPIWPWILGLLIVAALLYFFVFRDNNMTDDNNRKTETEEVKKDTMERRTSRTVNVTEISAYNKYISDPEMTMDHEYTSKALLKLISATSATAAAVNLDVDADLRGAKAKAKEIKDDSSSMAHANKIKDVAHSVSQALKKIQKEKYPQLHSEYKKVETAISDIKTDVPTLEQKDAIKGFLRKSGNLLTSIQNDYGKEK